MARPKKSEAAAAVIPAPVWPELEVVGGAVVTREDGKPQLFADSSGDVVLQDRMVLCYNALRGFTDDQVRRHEFGRGGIQANGARGVNINHVRGDGNMVTN